MSKSDVYLPMRNKVRTKVDPVTLKVYQQYRGYDVVLDLERHCWVPVPWNNRLLKDYIEALKILNDPLIIRDGDILIITCKGENSSDLFVGIYESVVDALQALELDSLEEFDRCGYTLHKSNFKGVVERGLGCLS